MLPINFFRNSGVSIKDFLKELKNGERDFFKALKTPEQRFEEASFEELMSNQSDVLCGVNKVQKNFSENYLGFFPNCLVKYHDNGDIKFVFYTTTYDSKKILSFSEMMFTELGEGVHNEPHTTSFRNQAKVVALSKKIYFNSSDEILHLWMHDDLTFLLQYRVQPLCQLSLMVTIKAQKTPDHSIRRKGTILELLSFDIDTLLASEHIKEEKELENDEVKFVDYTFILRQKELGVFDRICIRIFHPLRLFRPEVYTSITLFSSKEVSADDQVALTEELYKMYGEDNSMMGEVQLHEREMLDEGEFWTGRNWALNESHGIWDTGNPDEKFAYSVMIGDMKDEYGFNVAIMGFNNLVDLFSVR
jgi:hypothetical protein